MRASCRSVAKSSHYMSLYGLPGYNNEILRFFKFQGCTQKDAAGFKLGGKLCPRYMIPQIQVRLAKSCVNRFHDEI